MTTIYNTLTYGIQKNYNIGPLRQENTISLLDPVNDILANPFHILRFYPTE